MSTGVDSQPQSGKEPSDGELVDQEQAKKKSRPKLKARKTMKSMTKSVRNIVKVTTSVRLLQRLFRRRKQSKKKKKKGKKSKLDDIPEVDKQERPQDAEEEEEGHAEEEEKEHSGETQDGTLPGEDVGANGFQSKAGGGEINEEHIKKVEETANEKLQQGHIAPTLIYTPGTLRSKADVGEIDSKNIKKVKELAKMMASIDEETKKKNDMCKVKHSAAAHFQGASHQSPEVRKVPLAF